MDPSIPCSEHGRTEPGEQSEWRPEQFFRTFSSFRACSRVFLRFLTFLRFSQVFWVFSSCSSGHFERRSEAEPARAAISSAPAAASALERPFRAPQRGRAGSSGHFERPSEAKRARAAISSALAAASGLERPFREPLRGRAGSSGHFERPSAAERAPAAISNALAN